MPENARSLKSSAPSNNAPSKRKSWLSFFCCGATDDTSSGSNAYPAPDKVRPNRSTNPVPDTVKFKGFTNQAGEPVTAFFVVQAVKDGGIYRTPIKYVSPQAEALLKSTELVGRDLSVLMPHPDFNRNHSALIGTFFENFLATGRNTSDFIGKGLHGLRNFSVQLPNGEYTKLNFTLEHTITRDPITLKPAFYVIAHLPSELELQKAREAGVKRGDVIQPLPAQVIQRTETIPSEEESANSSESIPGLVMSSF